jgi:hypothetical protein
MGLRRTRSREVEKDESALCSAEPPIRLEIFFLALLAENFLVS